MIKFLFLDGWPLEYVRGFERCAKQPVKCTGNPLLVPERPHEFKRVQLYGSVLHEPESSLFKMWYSTHRLVERVSTLCLAISHDGYKWERPDLDIVPGTNIVLDSSYSPHGPSVIRDAVDPDASRRYKLLMKPNDRMGIEAFFSPDGVHWRRAQPEPVIGLDSDSHIGLYRDAGTGLYQASLRALKGDRRVWRTESRDFIHWRRPVLALEPDVSDPPLTQIYGLQMSPYGNYVMGWASMFHPFESDLRWQKANGTMDVALAYSRSGYAWHRAEVGSAFIPTGKHGEWDEQLIIPATGPILLEDEMRFYYAGARYHHGEYLARPEEMMCIGAASLRPDGFVSLRAGEAFCEILTRPFALHTPEIYVNADASGGEVRVEVQGASGEPVPGFTLADCQPVRGDGIAERVRFAADPSGSQIVGRPIRLKTRARQSELYSIFMPNGDMDPPYWSFREIRCVDPLRDLELAS
jgi:hypothetical protein